MAKRKTPKKASARKPRPASPKAKTRDPHTKSPTVAYPPDFPDVMGKPEHDPFPGVSDRKKRAFLASFKLVGAIGRAAKAAGVSPRTHLNWMKADAAYVEAFDVAKMLACETLEAEAIRRAVTGLVRYKFAKNGKPILHPVTGEPYYELEHSDTLLIFLMKGANPAKYRERLDVTSGDKPVKLYATLSPEEI